jgi:hypothetical protein
MEDGREGEHIVPDLVSYNSVLSAYMNSNTKEADFKTQKLMQHMVTKDVEPDLLSYTICINTLAKSKVRGSAQKADDLLNVLEHAYKEGNASLKPDVKCYNSGKLEKKVTNCSLSASLLQLIKFQSSTLGRKVQKRVQSIKRWHF